MTISSTTRRAGPYQGDGVTTTFAFAFKVFQASDLDVIETVIQTGTDLAPLVLGSDYSVSLNADQNNNPGGTVTLLAGALSTLNELTITSSISALQGASIANQSGFYPQVIENSLDYLTILVQQLLQTAGRSIQVPLSDGALNALPPAAQRLGQALVFDGVTGQPTVGTAISQTLSQNQIAYFGADTGAANAYVVAPVSAVGVQLIAGLTVSFSPVNANTGASTLNVSGLGAKSIVLPNGSALPANALIAGGIVTAKYTGSAFQLVGSGITPNELRTAAEIAAGVTPTNYYYPADPYIDPRRYGADPTGVSDSTVAVQTAINVAYQAKGTVWIGNGCNFLCGALSLTMTGNQGTLGLRILGSSRNGSTITANNPVGAQLTIQGATPSGAPTPAQIVIENLSISGPGGANPTPNGLVLQGVADFLISNVTLSGYNANLYLNSALTGTVFRSAIYGGRYGILAREDGAGSGNNLVHIQDTIVDSAQLWGIDFGSGDRLKISGCDIEGNGQHTAFTFTAGLASNSTSGTLSTPWALPSAQYPVYFSDGEVRMVTMTNGATTATWTTGLTSSVTANAAFATGALVIRNTVNFGVGYATIDIDGCWFEVNNGQTMAVESTSHLFLAIRDCNFYSDYNGQCLLIAGAQSVLIENSIAPSGGTPAVWNISVTNLTLRNVACGTLTDTSATPFYFNVSTSGGAYTLGRPDTSVTLTLTGCTTSPTQNPTITQQGPEISIAFSPGLSATSNSTACTLTGLPSKYQPSTNQNVPVCVNDNSAAVISGADLVPASGTITFDRTFTASGVKGLQNGTTIRYRLSA